MSASREWTKRQDRYHYSQDDRTLSYKFKKELDPMVDKFIDTPGELSVLIGSFNIAVEPWRLLSVNDFRQLGLKVVERKNEKDPALTDLFLVKKRMSQQRLG